MVSPSGYFLSFNALSNVKLRKYSEVDGCQSELYFLEFPNYTGSLKQDPITVEVIKNWKQKRIVREFSGDENKLVAWGDKNKFWHILFLGGIA